MDPLVFYKSLADNTRLKCLLLIQHEEELCVCELISALSLSQPKISRHLAQLRQSGLLKDRRQGKWVFYRINESLPGWCHQVLQTSLNNNTDFLNTNLTQLNAMGDRPDRAQVCCD